MNATQVSSHAKDFSVPEVLCAGRARILVADVAEGIDEMESLLGEVARVVCATSVPEAIAWLRSGVDAVIVGVHFDESRMLDLLRSAKSEIFQRLVPFICYRAFDTIVEDPAGLEVACKALDAEFVDLCALQRRYGTQESRAVFLDVVRRHISDSKVGEF